jgi:uncharacterized protein YutE (UPF0331/DUF86 family)
MTALEEYLEDLADSRTLSLNEFLKDKIKRRFIERTLQIAMEACLDIANHLISIQGFREPIDSRDAFQVLWQEGIIDETLMGKLKRMAQFRNILVHDYTRVQPEIVYSALMKDSLDMEVFTECIVKYESN